MLSSTTVQPPQVKQKPGNTAFKQQHELIPAEMPICPWLTLIRLVRNKIDQEISL